MVELLNPTRYYKFEMHILNVYSVIHPEKTPLKQANSNA